MLASHTESNDATSSHNLLLFASSNCDLQLIKELVEKGVDVNECNEIGQTALLAASIANKTEACALLLEYGAKVDHSDIGGYTALHLTTDAEITNLLLRYIKNKELINARTKYNRTPLHEAAFRGVSGKVFALLSNHAEVNAEDVNKATPLHYAVARSGDIDVSLVEALIEAGADVNKQNIFLQTPLMIACKQLQFMRNIITTLLKAGADPVIQANDGNTAVHVLFLGINLFERIISLDVVEEIVDANKKCLETVNIYGELPFHGVLSHIGKQNEKIALRLLTYDSVMSESTDNLGRTVLHLACKKDYLGIIEKFVENPTVINVTDCLGRSTLHYSCMHSEDGYSVKLIFQSKTFQVCGLVDCFGYTAYQYAKARRSEVGKKLLKHFDDHVRKTHCDKCMADTVVLRKYSEVFEDVSEQLSPLLTKIMVDTSGIILPTSLRPIANADDYVDKIWSSCISPVKKSENFEIQKSKVEHFMKNLIVLMKEYDARFSGKLRMRGSAYEGTIADDRGDFDYMLDIDSLSSICSVREKETDPPGFIRVGLDEGKDPGIFKDFFDADGLLRSEKILSNFSLAVMYALHQPSLWRTCAFDFFRNLQVTWKDRPALSITCMMFHMNTFVSISIDFLPAIHTVGWWPSGFDCHGFLDRHSLELGCQLIIKHPNVPYYQHTQFGDPRQYLKMSFSEAETHIFQKSHANIRQAFIVAKLLLDREVKIPWSFVFPGRPVILQC